MDFEKIKSDIEKLSAKKFEITGRADAAGRELTPEEETLVAEMDGAILALQKNLPQKAVTLQSGSLGYRPGGGIPSGPYALRGPNDRKDYKSLFGDDGFHWTDKETNFFSAVFSGRHHPGLVMNSMVESLPSDGGFLVPVQQAERIHAVSLENELVMPRCYVQPMKTNTIKIPAMSIGDHSTALFGGFTASYVDEAGTISENDPKARAMELNAKKLTGLIRFSSELSADVPGGFGQIETLCGRGLAWYRDKAFLKGTGAGEPLGLMNANCVVEVEKQTGQASQTIVYENLTDMMSRMFAGSFSNSVWVCHQSTIPQLLSLSIAVGLAGSAVPVLQESNGEFKILTRPVIFTEKTEPLGTRGDIMLCDFSQYVVGLRSAMRFDTSIHAHFTTDFNESLYAVMHIENPVNSGETLSSHVEGNPEPSPVMGRCNDYSERKYTQASGSAGRPVKGDDIVWSAWKHAAAA